MKSIYRRSLLASAFALAFMVVAASGSPPAAGAEPPDQVAFGRYIASAYWTWRRLESNEIARGTSIEDRGANLREAMKNETAFDGWELIVAHVGVDHQGHAWIALMQETKGTPRYILTSAVVDPDDVLRQRLPLGSPLYFVASTLVQGDRVIASGELFTDDRDGYVELGRFVKATMHDRMRMPQFLVRYTALRAVPKSDRRSK